MSRSQNHEHSASSESRDSYTLQKRAAAAVLTLATLVSAGGCASKEVTAVPKPAASAPAEQTPGATETAHQYANTYSSYQTPEMLRAKGWESDAKYTLPAADKLAISADVSTEEFAKKFLIGVFVDGANAGLTAKTLADYEDNLLKNTPYSGDQLHLSDYPEGRELLANTQQTLSDAYFAPDRDAGAQKVIDTRPVVQDVVLLAGMHSTGHDDPSEQLYHATGVVSDVQETSRTAEEIHFTAVLQVSDNRSETYYARSGSKAGIEPTKGMFAITAQVCQDGKLRASSVNYQDMAIGSVD